MLIARSNKAKVNTVEVFVIALCDDSVSPIRPRVMYNVCTG